MANLTLLACQNSDVASGERVEDKRTASQKETGALKRLDAVIVARVGDTPIFQSDVERVGIERGVVRAGQPLSQTSPQYAELLESLIDQRLLAQAAVKRALDQTDDNQRRLATARERILSNILIEAHLKEKVNETTIQRLYEEQSALADRGDEVRARHILLEDKASAIAALDSLKSEESFASLARSISLDKASRDKGGDLGYVTRDMPPPDLADVIFRTAKGERTEVFETEMGWHILEVLDRRPARKQSLETLRPNIVKFLTFEAIDSLIAELRSGTKIETFIEAPAKLINVESEDSGQTENSSDDSAPEEN
jgi:peptidyl-prolyl cis-trans isomerase C